MAQMNCFRLCKKDNIKFIFQQIYRFFRQDLFKQEVKKSSQIIIKSSPISNIQLEKNFNMSATFNLNKQSTNDNLCSTFQGLFKNGKQHEQITMSTAWNYGSSSISANNQIEFILEDKSIEIDHNQKQKNVSEKDLIEQKQNSDKQKSTKKTFINPNLILLQKQSILSKRTHKLQKLKNLLPYYYNMKLPQSYKNLLTIAQKIDNYLIQKRKSNFYMDNVFNIFRKLFQNEQMSQIWLNVKKIMFLSEDYYKINVDPLKNLALGIKHKKDVKVFKRKEKLRKNIVDYYITQKNNQTNDSNNEEIVFQIPQNIIEPTKTSKFYLQNMDLASSSQKIIKILEQPSGPKLKTQFISTLKSTVSQKQAQQQSLIQSQSQQSCPKPINLSQFRQFCQTIHQIYKQKKVKNMYKTSLIDCLRKSQKFQLTKIFQFIKFIIKEGLFLEVLIKPNFCQIFHIRTQEKEKLIQFYQIKHKQVFH